MLTCLKWIQMNMIRWDIEEHTMTVHHRGHMMEMYLWHFIASPALALLPFLLWEIICCGLIIKLASAIVIKIIKKWPSLRLRRWGLMYSPLKIVVDVMAQVACRGHDLLGSFLTPQRGTGAKEWQPGSDFCRLTLLAVSKQTFISGRTRIQVRIRAWWSPWGHATEHAVAMR